MKKKILAVLLVKIILICGGVGFGEDNIQREVREKIQKEDLRGLFPGKSDIPVLVQKYCKGGLDGHFYLKDVPEDIYIERDCGIDVVLRIIHLGHLKDPERFPVDPSKLSVDVIRDKMQSDEKLPAVGSFLEESLFDPNDKLSYYNIRMRSCLVLLWRDGLWENDFNVKGHKYKGSLDPHHLVKYEMDANSFKYAKDLQKKCLEELETLGFKFEKKEGERMEENEFKKILRKGLKAEGLEGYKLHTVILGCMRYRDIFLKNMHAQFSIWHLNLEKSIEYANERLVKSTKKDDENKKMVIDLIEERIKEKEEQQQQARKEMKKEKEELENLMSKKVKAKTSNQKKVGKALDIIMDGEKGEDKEIIKELEEIYGTGEEESKGIMTKVSGHFLANVVRSGVNGNEKKKVYGRLKLKKGKKERRDRGIWCQYSYNYREYAGEENSPGEYTDRESGVMIGLDFKMGKKVVIGPCVKVSKHEMKQKEDRGEIKRGMVGIYGGCRIGLFEAKWLMMGHKNDYETKRKVIEKDIVKGKFRGEGLGGDIEVGMRVWKRKGIKVMPYIGFEEAVEKREEIKEEGRLGLKIKGGEYRREQIRVGIGIGKEKGGIRYYGDVGYKRIMKGEEVKIKGELRGVEIEGEIEGIKEGKDRIAIGAGVGIDLGKDIGINVNINYEGAKKYKEMYGNIGISWGF